MSYITVINNYVPAIEWGKLLERSKTIRIIGSVVAGCHFGWKILRFLSLSGNSKNPLYKFLHRLLRNHLNCGIVVRNEFGVSLPWQFFFNIPGRYIIVNYGSYGTVPNRVMDYQISLQRELESCPDSFYRTEMPTIYRKSLKTVAQAIGSDSDNVVFVENVTEGINCALRSFLCDFKENDAVLCTNLTYSAVLKTIRILTERAGLKMCQVDIQYPILSEDAVCKAFEDVLRQQANIKLVVFDHITSASATCFPIKKIAEICRRCNVISVVDGAHAPGQLFMEVQNYGVDVYIGNLHKWYYTPKSCAVMYVKPEHHDKIQPSLISHGIYGNLQERFRRQGTRTYAAQMAAGYAVDFVESFGGLAFLRSYITPLVEYAAALYVREWGTNELQIPDSMKAPYMRIVYLPDSFTRVGGSTQADADRMIIEMLQEYNVAIFINPIGGRQTTRVSAQIFSTKREYIAAAAAIKKKARRFEELEKSSAESMNSVN